MKRILSEKQEKFVDYYLEDPLQNASAAARKAGYSQRTAGQRASEMLANPYIRQVMEDRKRDIVKKVNLDPNYVVDGILKSIEEAKLAGIGAWQAQAIQRGFEMLGRYLGMFKDQVEVGLDEKLMLALAMGRKRAAEAQLTKGEKDDGVLQGPGGVSRDPDKDDPGGGTGSVN
jgi:phage terminase small subunit